MKWLIKSIEKVFDADPYFYVEKHKVLLPTGRKVDNYYQLKLPNFTSVIAVDAEKKFLIFRGYRHGIRGMSFSFPGGGVEIDESFLQCAKRELREETGFEGEDWVHKGSFVGDASKQCGHYHIFATQNIRETTVPDSGDLEDVELVRLSKAELAEIIQSKQPVSLGFVATVFFALALRS
tara:strand:- start:130777 stop:131313 length:537 start_codon:yes stop_codon:yes gene_type:complete